jgi:hypothetical protein
MDKLVMKKYASFDDELATLKNDKIDIAVMPLTA